MIVCGMLLQHDTLHGTTMSSYDPTDIVTDTTKAFDVPGKPPGTCPSCDHKFSNVVKPPRRLQKKAKLMIALGLFLSIAWASVLWIGFLVVSSNMDYVIVPINIITGSIAVAAIAVPAYLVGIIAMRFPRIVKLQCKKCCWQKKYLVDSRGKIASHSQPKNHDE